jgi:hypothetical protein
MIGCSTNDWLRLAWCVGLRRWRRGVNCTTWKVNELRSSTLYELAARACGLAAHQLPLAECVSLARSVMPDAWPSWTVTQGSERPADPIEVVDYDIAWPARFERWWQLLRSALGDVALRIEHVGSTSVPCLAAKPIVDVQVSVADLDNEAAYAPPTEAVGLQLRSRDELHRYVRPIRGAPRDVHVPRQPRRVSLGAGASAVS